MSIDIAVKEPVIGLSIEEQKRASRIKWLVLALATLTNTLVAAVPSMCMPVLFDQISADLHLTLVQVGVIWGISALPGIFTALIGGTIGDHLGPRRVLLASCLLIGFSGALRGTATSFGSLAATMILFGMFTSFITTNTFKMCGMWFPRSQMGLASGILSMGMALGFLSSSMLSATVLAPWLGSWQNVLFLFGGIAAGLSIPWFFIRVAPAPEEQVSQGQGFSSLWRNLAKVARIRKVWLFGLVMLGISGCVQGTLGYLALYLRGQGWTPSLADGALASFHTISMICVIPIALLSDKIGSRRRILLPATLMITIGVGLLSVLHGPAVWIAVCLAGMVRDGFMAVFTTAIMEIDGVGTTFTGTAMGLIMIFSGLGNLFAPPIGNSLAAFTPGLPFAFWSLLTLIALGALLASGENSQPVSIRPAL